MKTKKRVLEHCIEILYEGLIMEQINFEWFKQKTEEMNDKESFEYHAEKSKYERSIDVRLRQIEIAQEMLKNYE